MKTQSRGSSVNAINVGAEAMLSPGLTQLRTIVCLRAWLGKGALEGEIAAGHFAEGLGIGKDGLWPHCRPAEISDGCQQRIGAAIAEALVRTVFTSLQ